LETLRDNFKIFIKKENAILAAKIESAEILSYENGCLTLGFPKDYIFLEDIKGKKQKDQLEEIAGKFFQGNVEIKIATTEAQKVNTTDNNGRGKTNSLNDMKREAINHPLLQKVMDEFAGAEVIEIKARTDKPR
jgi:DNA polymerase-3 subunit gamma/tau